MNDVWPHLEISRTQAAEVVVATLVLYTMLLVAMRWWGRRLRASSSSASIAAVTVLGSVVGRSMLGDVPNLSGGLLAFTTLVVLETTYGRLRRRASSRFPEQRPRAVLVDGRVDDAALAAARLTEHELAARLRRHGVLRVADVALAVLEPGGSLTVVPAGARVDEDLVADVLGAEGLPGTVVRRSAAGGSPRS